MGYRSSSEKDIIDEGHSNSKGNWHYVDNNSVVRKMLKQKLDELYLSHS